jgi:uncharacterized protein YndB with AHSA1/START domain
MADAQLVPIKRIGPNAIRLQRILNAPPETVWRYLTEAELRSQWFMGGADATAGGNFDLVVNHGKLSDDESVPYPESYAANRNAVWAEKVLRFEPPHLLETTFQGGRNGTVTYELLADGERTRLVLTHSGITSGTGAADFGAGWNSHITLLAERLAGRGVPNFWALHAQSRDVVRQVLGS